ncbi:WD40 repeat-like protein [Fomitiporia mediterranea MF3/22]|uniref:WD40 repeat-like protein n=1 Tax=Fomitiporia mediterranea (strain MF3/22) TaxID=694068 RepID=UPI000440879A|nr:WD40 repeat-like protein [Fomitiporia mediterranea MF3/22]EJC98898.1 WD40 repeat-like protein [Fomitiporia mediterranea MF3/22]
MIKFNREGDLLFSCSKDQVINVWFSDNGERLGTYDGHNGTVWTIDVDHESRFLVSGAADNTMKLWEVSTGRCLYTWEFPTAVKRVAFSADSKQIVCITEQRMGYQSAIRIFDINREGDGRDQSEEPGSMFNPIGSKPTVCTFALTPSLILTGHESGKVALFDAKTGEEVNNNERAHMDVVTDLQLSPDRTYFITSSKDKTARLHDTRTLNVLKTYQTETPLNSAAIATLRPYVLLGGGQDAMSVTTTSSRQGKFETRFWHKIFEEELGRVKGHFGPINTLAVHPSGKGYASGGEDGFVRVHHFDDSYFKAKPYGDLEIEDQNYLSCAWLDIWRAMIASNNIDIQEMVLRSVILLCEITPHYLQYAVESTGLQSPLEKADEQWEYIKLSITRHACGMTIVPHKWRWFNGEGSRKFSLAVPE